jgi:hypothetical protein
MKPLRVLKTAWFVGLTASMVSWVGAGEVKFGPPVRLAVPDCVELEGPEVVDFDGDGLRDLLSGVYDGYLLFRRNTGTDAVPQFAKPVKVQSGGKDIELEHW